MTNRGAPVIMNMIKSLEVFIMKCPACGTKCAKGSRFCNMCGGPLATAPVVMEKVSKKEEGVLGKIAHILRNGLLLAVALILLITAFSPIVRIDFGELSRDLDGFYYNISPVETVVIFANSLYTYYIMLHE